MTEETKSISYSQIVSDVSRAWELEHDYRGWVVEVMSDVVVVYMDKKHWEIPYTTVGEDITFGKNSEWKEVERSTEWRTKMGPAIKSLGEDRIGGWAVLYGDEAKKDLHGNWFTPETEEYLNVFKAIGALPWLFHHGSDPTVKAEVVGIVDTMDEEEIGIWFEAKIREHEMYRKYVEPLMTDKKLFTSTGALPGAAMAKKSGEVSRWPIIDVTGTHIPAEWRMMERPVEEIKAVYKSAGIEFPDDLLQPTEQDDNEQSEQATEEEPRTGVEEARGRLEVLSIQLDLISV